MVLITLYYSLNFLENVNKDYQGNFLENVFENVSFKENLSEYISFRIPNHSKNSTKEISLQFAKKRNRNQENWKLLTIKLTPRKECEKKKNLTENKYAKIKIVKKPTVKLMLLMIHLYSFTHLTRIESMIYRHCLSSLRGNMLNSKWQNKIA